MSSRGYRGAPVGSKMTDSGYPFRGEYRLDDSINHGHSGVTRKQPTSLALKITGSNLVIEQLQTNKGTEMACEIGVDGGVPRPVTFDAADVVALAVPGDGHDYNLTAVLKTEYAKHFCRMSFNGSEGKSYVRIRAPDDVNPDIIYLYADGRRLRPSAGWYSIPLATKDCSLALSLPATAHGAPSSGQRVSPNWVEDELAPLPSLHGGPRGTHDGAAPAPPSAIVVETAPGTADYAVLRCAGSGQNIPLKKSEAVAIPTNAGPYTLELPLERMIMANPAGTVPAPAPPGIAAPVPVPVAGGGVPAPVPVPVGGAGAPGTGTAATTEAPELETRVTAGAGGGTPSFTATCKNYFVQLTSDNGTTMSGFGSASLPLANRYAQRVRIVITDNQGKVFLRQSNYVPALQAQPITIRMTEDANGMLVAGNERTTITLGSTKSTGTQGIRVNRSSLQRVVVEQNHLDGTSSSATLDIGAKPYVPPTSAAGNSATTASSYNPYGAASPSAGSASPKPDEQWIATLVQATQASSVEESRRLMNQVRAPHAQAATLVSYVSDSLFKAPPIISFTTSETHVQSMNCPGYNLTATIQNQQPCLMPANSQVQVPPNSSAVITAVNPKNGKQIASVRVQLSPTPSTAVGAPSASARAASQPGSSAPAMPLSPYGSGVVTSPSDTLDAQLVARLLDTMQRRNMDPASVAQELQNGAAAASLSPTAQRMLPLLINTLLQAGKAGPATTPPELFFTCGNGYLTNIYTEHPQYQISASVDSQPPVMVSQRGRLPADGSSFTGNVPRFVRLTARDPITAAVKADLTVTVLGAHGGGQSGTNPAGAFTSSPYPGSSGASPFAQAAHAATGVPSVPTLPSGLGATTGVPPQPPTSLSAVPDSAPRQNAASADASASAAPGAADHRNRAVLPSLDITMQRVESDQQLRFVCASHLRIVCTVNGNGGDTGRSDFVTKLPANRAHSLHLTLLDYYGQTAFQQKLELPASNDAPVWGLALQENGVAVDPDGNSLVTYALDRSPERAAQGGFVGFTTDTAHVLHLRKYLNGMHAPCVGQLTLRVPGFVSLAELEALAAIYRERLGNRLDDDGAKSQLRNLANRVTSPQVRTLIGLLLDSWSSVGGLPAVRSAQGTSAGSYRALPAQGDQGQVYFRLSGM